jgi:hypothetical protein
MAIAAGGARRWLPFSRSISISVRIIVGTRFTIISEILVRITISTIVVACGRSVATSWPICAATILLI